MPEVDSKLVKTIVRYLAQHRLQAEDRLPPNDHEFDRLIREGIAVATDVEIVREHDIARLICVQFWPQQLLQQHEVIVALHRVMTNTDLSAEQRLTFVERHLLRGMR